MVSRCLVGFLYLKLPYGNSPAEPSGWRDSERGFVRKHVTHRVALRNTYNNARCITARYVGTQLAEWINGVGGVILTIGWPYRSTLPYNLSISIQRYVKVPACNLLVTTTVNIQSVGSHLQLGRNLAVRILIRLAFHYYHQKVEKKKVFGQPNISDEN